MKPILFTLLVSVTFGMAADKPNIIYIMADDLGYGDLGCFGSNQNKTPHIDALADRGVRLTDFHAAAWCAPSRRALMTGCHANRPWNRNGKKMGRVALAITLPETLEANGYSTAIIGKWHLGVEEGLHPLDQGFDYWYGTLGSNDWDGPPPNYASFRNAPEKAWKTPLIINRKNHGHIVPQSEFTKRYTEESIRLIKESKDNKPFFLYLAHNMPHVPIFASDAFRGTSKNGIYGDVIAEIDWSVGEIVRALAEADLISSTLIVFTSDNGPWTMFNEFGGVATPLRGEKSTTWEGGDRVPCIISWPGKIRPKVSREFMMNYDIYATIAGLTKSSVPEGHAIDSLDLSSMLLDGMASPRKKHLHYMHRPMAMRSGNYKLHVRTRERTRDPETGKQEPSVTQNPPLLFNVKNDPSEQRNLAAEQPEIVKRLQQEMLETEKALKNWQPF
ncbi:MAG: sulfatase-like hydrolase/transferase [Verrucomicrobiaceae bacterium]|jgi:arylsulfatase A-like enzyme|nr:sulfatase [Verrucomicrobiales bacterium]MDC0504043.1 sulfatase [Verrucomicrobiales bacterium]NCF92394.1 sulfatase-like hydrolase/transferase [Verrucomicrobiaceae bacterium]